LCDLNNQNTWDTSKAVLIGVGIRAQLGNPIVLDGMVGQQGADSPWVQDPSLEVWDSVLGENAPRRQVVILDHNRENKFQKYYSSTLSNSEINELLLTVQNLINSIPPNIDLGDTNLDGDINVADIVVLVNFILEVESYNDIEFQASDLNNDNTLTVQDIIVLVNLILGI
tara:strand:- start:13273 stop:13782 length:510 start_codon:yes stop_codon:yes gene_type:complete